MNDKHKLTKPEAGPELQEIETSDLQAIVGGRVEVYRNVSYPAGGFPSPSPWHAAAFPNPEPWLVAAQQQYVIGT
jgi:hypothetical protein